MLRILLLDCSESLGCKLESQGFNVETGTVGFCAGVRKLPSQVYEKDVFCYDPESLRGDGVDAFKNSSPEYDLRYLEGRIRNGATFVAFLNQLSSSIEIQRLFYYWIPHMPEVEFTSDKLVSGNEFGVYPHSEASYLAPVVTASNLSLPVLLKLKPPKPQDYPCDVFPLFWNGFGHCLGVQILRGRGSLIFLPKFKSNDEVIETFLHRVVPRIYRSSGKSTLTDIFSSPVEQALHADFEKLQSTETQLKKQQERVRVQLAAAGREKEKIIEADATAKQILVYYDHARREDDVALYYLYKIVEAIENKCGGEAEGIKAVGVGTEWKARPNPNGTNMENSVHKSWVLYWNGWSCGGTGTGGDSPPWMGAVGVAVCCASSRASALRRRLRSLLLPTAHTFAQ